VEKEKITGSNANDIIEAGEILNKITDESKKVFPDNIPILKSLREVIETHIGNAKKLTSQAKAEKSSADTKGGVESEKQTAGTQTGTDRPKPQSAVLSKAAPGSEKDAIKQLRQTLLFFFEREAEGDKKELVPDDPVVFGMSRQLQWGNLIRPIDNSNITQIDAPNQIIQNKLKEWFSSSNWDTLIPRIEISFLKPDSEFPYWLDMQRYAAIALEKKGGNYAQAAKEIKYHLAVLLRRIPDLPKLIFKDKQTPLANDETKKWIDDEVKPVLAGGSTTSILLPPVMGEEYEAINNEYKEAVDGLPGNLEETVQKMQQGIKSDERRKGKFLRRLNLANFYFAAKEYNLAKINLQELTKSITEYNLAEWEPALCTAVWQSLYVTNSKIDSGKKDSKLEIEKEQDELFSKIAKYDGVTAIKLINKLKP
jgi:type VI secretion system ImpA/VasJ family protein